MECSACGKELTDSYFKIFDDKFCDNNKCLHTQYTEKQYDELYDKYSESPNTCDLVYWTTKEKEVDKSA